MQYKCGDRLHIEVRNFYNEDACEYLSCVVEEVVMGQYVLVREASGKTTYFAADGTLPGGLRRLVPYQEANLEKVREWRRRVHAMAQIRALKDWKSLSVPQLEAIASIISGRSSVTEE